MREELRNQQLFLGIDGGGTKCKAILVNESDEILGVGISGSANPLHGFELATTSIIEAATIALKSAGLDNLSLEDITAGVGLAGVNLPAQFKQMQAWQSPFKTMYLAHDLKIACFGAHEKSTGAVIITGTGSCGYSNSNGKELLVGGHGFPQGDQASGAWFGLQVVQQVLLSLDGIIAPSIMNELLWNKLQCENATAIVEAVALQSSTFYAQLAHIVFDSAEQGDELALAIIKEGANYIDTLASLLLAKEPVRISLLGGLADSLIPWLTKETQSLLSKPLHSPEMGAVYFARNELAQKTQ